MHIIHSRHGRHELSSACPPIPLSLRKYIVNDTYSFAFTSQANNERSRSTLSLSPLKCMSSIQIACEFVIHFFISVDYFSFDERIIGIEGYRSCCMSVFYFGGWCVPLKWASNLFLNPRPKKNSFHASQSLFRVAVTFLTFKGFHRLHSSFHCLKWLESSLESHWFVAEISLLRKLIAISRYMIPFSQLRFRVSTVLTLYRSVSKRTEIQYLTVH